MPIHSQRSQVGRSGFKLLAFVTLWNFLHLIGNNVQWWSILMGYKLWMRDSEIFDGENTDKSTT